MNYLCAVCSPCCYVEEVHEDSVHEDSDSGHSDEGNCLFFNAPEVEMTPPDHAGVHFKFSNPISKLIKF